MSPTLPQTIVQPRSALVKVIIIQFSNVNSRPLCTCLWSTITFASDKGPFLTSMSWGRSVPIIHWSTHPPPKQLPYTVYRRSLCVFVTHHKKALLVPVPWLALCNKTQYRIFSSTCQALSAKAFTPHTSSQYWLIFTLGFLIVLFTISTDMFHKLNFSNIEQA